MQMIYRIVCLFVVALSALPYLAYTQTNNEAKYAVPDDPAQRAALELRMTADPATGRLPDNIRERELSFSKSIQRIEERNAQSMLKPARIAAQNWVSRGPDNVGGRTRALAVDISNPDNLLAGGVSGGMWRSIDGGDSWVLVSDRSGLLTVTCIAQDTRPGKSATWYYGSGEYHVNHPEFYRGDGLYKSTDNGITWTALASTAAAEPQDFDNWSFVYKVIVDPTDLENDIVYAATAGGIYRSSDGGGTWDIVLGRLVSDDEQVSFRSDLSMDKNGVLYAALSAVVLKPSTGEIVAFDNGAAGLFRSEDGENWTEITPQDYPSTWRAVSGIDPSDPSTVYFLSSNIDKGFETVGVSGNSGYASLYKYRYISGDGSGAGGSWTNLTDNLPAFGNYGRFNTQQGYNLVVKVSPDNSDIVYLGATSLYRSINGFATNTNTSWIGGYHHDFKIEDPLYDWLIINYPNHHPDVHEILFDRNNPKIMYSSTDGGVSKTLDCESDSVEWINLNNGMLTTQFYALGIHPSAAGDDRILGGMQDNGSYATIGSGNDWTMVASGDGFGCEIAPDLENTYYCTMYSGILTKTSADAAGVVSAIERIAGHALANDGFDFVTEWLLDPNDASVAYMAGDEYIYRNTDITDQDAINGWVQLSQSGPVRGTISAMAATHGLQTGLYFGTSEGWLFWIEDVRNSDSKPKRVDGGDLPFKSYISCISVDRTDPQKLLVVVSNYNIPSLFYTTDGGQNWADVSGNLEEQPDGSGAGPSCRWAEIVTRDGKQIFLVGTSTGLYSSELLAADATIWTKEGTTTIGSALVSCMRSRDSDGFVAVGTYGSGVFASHVTPVSVNETPGAPNAFFLEAAYPNPARAYSSIRMHVPHAQAVRITLHNSAGAVVKTVLDAIAESGVHPLRVSTEQLPAGHYFIRLSSGGYSMTRLVAVVK